MALAQPFTLTNTFHASLTEEYPQRDVIMSELGTCVLHYVEGSFLFLLSIELYFFQKGRGVGGVTVLALSVLHFYPINSFFSVL